jgi:hypothetical protein
LRADFRAFKKICQLPLINFSAAAASIIIFSNKFQLL